MPKQERGAGVATSAPTPRSCADCSSPVQGRSHRCEPCKKLRNRARVADWQRRNREQYNAKGRRWYAENRDLHAARAAAWRAQNPEKVAAQKAAQTSEQRRNWYLRSRYGITLEDQRRMWAQQGGCCAICVTPLTDDTLAVDHDHDTGEVRGLLCRLCNSGLGAFEANPEQLLIAYSYLTRRR